VRARLQPKKSRGTRGAWGLYYLGRFLQVLGLMVTLVAATAFFGTPSTIKMLRMMLLGVLIYLPGWWLSHKDPGATGGQAQ
jgi:hypothetical protein